MTSGRELDLPIRWWIIVDPSSFRQDAPFFTGCNWRWESSHPTEKADPSSRWSSGWHHPEIL